MAEVPTRAPFMLPYLFLLCLACNEALVSGYSEGRTGGAQYWSQTRVRLELCCDSLSLPRIPCTTIAAVLSNCCDPVIDKYYHHVADFISLKLKKESYMSATKKCFSSTPLRQASQHRQSFRACHCYSIIDRV